MKFGNDVLRRRRTCSTTQDYLRFMEMIRIMAGPGAIRSSDENLSS